MSVLDKIRVTPVMVAEGLRVIRDSGTLEYENLVDETLMKRILWAALAKQAIQDAHAKR